MQIAFLILSFTKIFINIPRKGLVGGEFGAYSFDEGDAYEQRFGPPIIMAGRLYVDIFPRRTGPGYPTCHEMGFACIDLRTGQEIWRKYGARLDFGQIYVYDSPNQHGAHAYLAGYAVKEMPSPATGLVVAIQSTTESLMSRIDTMQTILITVIVIVILLVTYDIYINHKMFRQASK